jgi:hypothetical protein
MVLQQSPEVLVALPAATCSVVGVWFLCDRIRARNAHFSARGGAAIRDVAVSAVRILPASITSAVTIAWLLAVFALFAVAPIAGCSQWTCVTMVVIE